MSDLRRELDYVLFTEADIASVVEKLAVQIDNDYRTAERRLVLVCILKGAMPFASDLMRAITLDAELEFMRVSSYGAGAKSSGVLEYKLDMKRDDLDKCDLLIIEDIVDSGVTLKNLTEHLKGLGAGSVRTCALLDKPSRRINGFSADYVGAEIPDEFVVGYGLDYNERYRTLPIIGVLRREVYEK